MSVRVAGRSALSPGPRFVPPVAAGRTAGQEDLRRLAFVSVVAVMMGAAIVWTGAVVALVAPAILGVLLLLLLQRFLHDPDSSPADDARLVHWMMAAFFAHLLVGLAVTYTPAAMKYLGGDANIYHTYAKWMLEFGESSLGPNGLEHGKEGYYYTLLGLYKVFGPHPGVGLALNAALGAALVPILTDTTRRLFGTKASHRVAPIVVLIPSMFLFTSQLLKEAPILFLFAVASNAAVRTMDRVSLSGSLVTAVSLALLLTFRAPVAFVAGAGLLLGLMVGKQQVLFGFTTGMGTLAVAGVMITTIGLGYSGFQATIERSNLEESNRQRAGLAYESGTGFGADVDTGSARKALVYLPVALTQFSLGPFPWQIRGLRQLPAFVDVLVLWFLWPSLARGARSAMREKGRRVAVLLLPAITTAAVLSLSVGNFGILMRERMQVLILVVPIIAYGVSLRDRKRKAAPAGAEAGLVSV